MPLEMDSHQVIGFSLMPVCRWPQRSDSGDLRGVPINRDLDSHPLILLERIEVVNNLEARRPGVVIDSTQKGKEVEEEVLVLLQKAAYLQEILLFYDDCRLSTKEGNI